jgi:recombination protein RecR
MERNERASEPVMKSKIAGPEIERLIQLLSRLPGLGHRSARKAAVALLKKRNELLVPLASALREAADKLVECPNCGNLDTVVPCTMCHDPGRDRSLIVVVEDVGDLWALERAQVTNAQYHVLGGHLSPLDGVGPEELNIPRLIERARSAETKEVLLALNATVEGQSTAHYLMGELETTGVAVSRLALGVPVGGELDYLDEGTLAAAIKARRRL